LNEGGLLNSAGFVGQSPTKEKAWHESAGLCFSVALKACFHKHKENKDRK
jgi:hypothetical protein